MRNIYAVRTRKGLVFYVEARNRNEAEQRALSPAVAKEIFLALLNELSRIQSVELHRGPAHTARSGLIFDDEFFQ